MISSAAPSGLQAETLGAYTLLHTLSPHWPGALILSVHLDNPGAALSLAANIAGAVSLTLEPDAASARSALRSGACDFVVNTLDEALRAIKNEVRQQRPLSVALQAEPAAVLDECLARGLAPQLFTAPQDYPRHAAALTHSGTRSISLRPTPSSPDRSPEALLDSLRAQLPWTALSARTWTFTTPADLRAFDSQALAVLPKDEAFRRRWLTYAPRLFPRDRHRVLWLTDEEQAALAHPAHLAT